MYVLKATSSDAYSSGPENSVVLNKRVGGIFFSPFIGENACFLGNFQILSGKKKPGWRNYFL